MINSRDFAFTFVPIVQWMPSTLGAAQIRARDLARDRDIAFGTFTWIRYLFLEPFFFFFFFCMWRNPHGYSIAANNRQQQSSFGLLPTKTPRWPSYAYDRSAPGTSYELCFRCIPFPRPLFRTSPNNSLTVEFGVRGAITPSAIPPSSRGPLWRR